MQNQNLSIEQRKFAIESIAFIDHENAPDVLLELGKLVEEKQLNEWIVEWTIRQSFTNWGNTNLKESSRLRNLLMPILLPLFRSARPNPQVSPTLVVRDDCQVEW